MADRATPGADRCELLCLDARHGEGIRSSLPDPDALGRAATVGKALADSTRLAVAAALLTGDELCVCDMGWVVGQAQNLASHHLRVLRSAGLVTSRRDGKLVMYRLTPLGRALVVAVLAATSADVPTDAVGDGAAARSGVGAR